MAQTKTTIYCDLAKTMDKLVRAAAFKHKNHCLPSSVMTIILLALIIVVMMDGQVRASSSLSFSA